MAILPVSLALPTKLSLPTVSYNCLSSFSSTSDDLSRSLSSLSLRNLPNARTAKSFTVRMGGGPRTFPGGVSKWQWKRMQKKKASQLLKARLMRERQIYEMRKRAELKAAVSELERPWEVVEQAAPNLFSVSADEQVKVLADRFQKPGGFDLWTENDGPQLFETPDGLPTARFFPKGVVHSIKPYGRVHFDDNTEGIEDEIDDLKMKSEGRLKGGLNSVFNSDQGSGEWLNPSGKSIKQRRPEDSDDESPHFLNSRVSGSRPDGDRNRGRRFSETEDSDEKSSYSSNSRVFSGVSRYQSDRNRRFSDRNPNGRFGEPEDSDEKSSDSSNYRVSSGFNGRQSGRKGNGNRHDGDQNLSGRFSEHQDRRRSGQGNIDGQGSGGRRGVHGAIKVSDSRQSAPSSPREQRNNSKPQIGGYNRSRRDSKPEKRRNSSVPEEVYDMSLQKDGSYSFGSTKS